LLEIGSNRSDQYEEQVLVRRSNSDPRSRTEKKRTYIERGTGSIGGDEALVGLDDTVDRVNEHIDRRRLHHENVGRSLHALGVLFGTKRQNAAVFALVDFHSFKKGLAVMKTSRSDMQW
jgi:hypothetical protein